jgi:hypothetical protein
LANALAGLHVEFSASASKGIFPTPPVRTRVESTGWKGMSLPAEPRDTLYAGCTIEEGGLETLLNFYWFEGGFIEATEINSWLV